MKPWRILNLVCAGAAICPGAALAHASEQGFILLLPTGFYTGAGVATVVLTVLALGLVPPRWVLAAFQSLAVLRLRRGFGTVLTSCGAAVLFWLLIWAGLAGPRDPLSNPLPLMVWSVFWVGLVSLQGVLGNIWAFLNPWSGPVTIIRKALRRPSGAVPVRVAQIVGLGGFIGFAGLLLVHPAPSDPQVLARILAVYWLFHAMFSVIYGPRWLWRAEAVSALLGCYGRLGIFARRAGRLRVGLPGWQIAGARGWSLVPALMAVLLLGVGSFDGLNETFSWLGRLGINPFEYPGRSAMMAANAGGLILVNLALIAALLLVIGSGLRLAGSGMTVWRGFELFAPTVLPIALGYHIAHYLPGFLVNGQYALVAFSDPLMRGDDWLGLGEFYVSTGFFNSQAPVRVIFLTQAGAVVAGHVLAVLLAHAVASRKFAEPRRVWLCLAPLSGFMIGYTFLGLWLLASPRF